jgi:phosphoenolpyruvate carboxykinase (ATP)
MRVNFIEEAIAGKKATLLASGALAVQTGKHTGRSANSRFIVRDDNTSESVDWGDVNKPMVSEEAQKFFTEIQKRLQGQNQGQNQGHGQSTYRVTSHVGPFPIEVTTTSAWHAAFADNMFRESTIESIVAQAQRSTSAFGTIRVFHDPYTPASQYGITAPEDAVIVLDPTNFRIAIAGTAYAGEIKKSAFSMANYLLPVSGILPMHSSANCLADGSSSCVIFGLSGTGKTTLSAQAGRHLIGDDEIVWSERGLSNLEGGCYAKLIGLTEESEPEIFRAVGRSGAILENVVFDEATLIPNFEDQSRTENTRGSYKLGALDRVFDQTHEADLPESIVFLTADAFGALPAVSRLDEWQMRYHFMSGFTAKVAGTEIGLKEPKAAFSSCFGAPFMPRNPALYASLLASRAAEAGSRVYLLNTGWIGGYKTGQRFPLPVTRRILEMIQSGEFDNAQFERHPIFGFEVPKSAKGIDSELLKSPVGPQVEDLARRFVANQSKFKGDDALEFCAKGGPSLGTSTTASEATL